IALKDEYLFCPEDGARLGEMPAAERVENTAPMKPLASAVVLYCPACAAEYPLTFSECPVHQTALITHGIPPLVEAPLPKATIETAAKAPLNGRRLHLVPSEAPPEAQPQRIEEAQPRRSSLEEYEQTLENLAQPVTSDHIGEPDELIEEAAAST